MQVKFGIHFRYDISSNDPIIDNFFEKKLQMRLKLSNAPLNLFLGYYFTSAKPIL